MRFLDRPPLFSILSLASCPWALVSRMVRRSRWSVSALVATPAGYLLASRPLSRRSIHLYPTSITSIIASELPGLFLRSTVLSVLIVCQRRCSRPRPYPRQLPCSCPVPRLCSRERFLPPGRPEAGSPLRTTSSGRRRVLPEAAGSLPAPPPVYRDGVAYGIKVPAAVKQKDTFNRCRRRATSIPSARFRDFVIVYLRPFLYRCKLSHAML